MLLQWKTIQFCIIWVWADIFRHVWLCLFTLSFPSLSFLSIASTSCRRTRGICSIGFGTWWMKSWTWGGRCWSATSLTTGWRTSSSTSRQGWTGETSEYQTAHVECMSCRFKLRCASSRVNSRVQFSLLSLSPLRQKLYLYEFWLRWVELWLWYLEPPPCIVRNTSKSWCLVGPKTVNNKEKYLTLNRVVLL